MSTSYSTNEICSNCLGEHQEEWLTGETTWPGMSSLPSDLDINHPADFADFNLDNVPWYVVEATGN